MAVDPKSVRRLLLGTNATASLASRVGFDDSSRLRVRVEYIDDGYVRVRDTSGSIDILEILREMSWTFYNLSQQRRLLENLDTTLSSRASESTLAAIKAQTDRLTFTSDNRLRVDALVSDQPLGLYDVLVRGAAYYVHALLNYVPLLTSDPALKLEPTPTAATSETTRFTRYILLAYASTPRTFLCSLAFSGTGHIYVRTLTATYYYRMYAKLAKTSDFSTFTDVTSEVTLMNYSRGAASADGWYDEGTISGVLNAKASLNAGEALLLVLRGTSWTSATCESSTGINTTNLRIYAAVLT